MNTFEKLHGKPTGPVRSQGGEELIILEYFAGRTGRFCDIGAYDGITFSNTYALAERGWSGVCVEPDPQAFEGLQRLYAGNPRIALVPVAISDVLGEVTFHSSRGGAVSTLLESHVRKWESAATFEMIKVMSMTPERLLEIHPGSYELLNCDVEGHSADLFEKFNLSEMGVEMAVVEHDQQEDRVIAHAAAHGLMRVFYHSAENTIVGR